MGTYTACCCYGGDQEGRLAGRHAPDTLSGYNYNAIAWPHAPGVACEH